MSNRYDDRSVLSEEARTVFPCTDYADDMMIFEVTRKHVILVNSDQFEQVGVGYQADDLAHPQDEDGVHLVDESRD